MKIAQPALTSAIVGLYVAVASAQNALQAGPDATDNAAALAPNADDAGRELAQSCATTLLWHPQYSAGWAGGYCLQTKDCNSPSYSTELACCKGSYGPQSSNACLSRLPNPPTTSPTGAGGLDVFYPDYNRPWADGLCINTRPLPNGRPTYTSMLACCKGAYGGQTSGNCLASLPSPPTTSPTGSGGLDYWYPDYETAWAQAACKNTRPTPFNPGDRPTYTTLLACCKSAYAGQTSGACLASLPSPPTTSPTGSGGLDYWYADYESDWGGAACKNTRPTPFNRGDRPTYTTLLACCKKEYAGQTSGACLASLPSPPTTSPTAGGGLDVWYKDGDDYANGKCTNARPLPQWRPTSATKEACCASQYGSQFSNACMCDANPCYSCKCADAQDATKCPALSYCRVTTVPPTTP